MDRSIHLSKRKKWKHGLPYLACSKVGVPKSTAMNLTFPERVTPFNKQLMQEMVQNGPEEWPGAKFVPAAPATSLARILFATNSALRRFYRTLTQFFETSMF